MYTDYHVKGLLYFLIKKSENVENFVENSKQRCMKISQVGFELFLAERKADILSGGEMDRHDNVIVLLHHSFANTTNNDL